MPIADIGGGRIVDFGNLPDAQIAEAIKKIAPASPQQPPISMGVKEGPVEPQQGGGMAGLWQTIKGEGGKMAAGLGGTAQALWDNLLAGAQGVKTYAAEEKGATLAPEAEQWQFAEADRVSDPSKFFVAREPQTQHMAVYQRTPAVEAGVGERMAQLGRAMPGAQPERFPMVAGGMRDVRDVRGGRMAAAPLTGPQALLQDFEAARVPPNVPTVGQGRGVGLAAQAARMLPGSPVSTAMRQGMQATEQGVESAAGGFGAAAPEDAGAIARNAMRRFAADKSRGNANYSEFFRLMHGASPAPATNTVRALHNMMGRFPSAPDLAGMFTSPTLRNLATRLEPGGGRPFSATHAGPSAPVSLTMPELKELRTQIGYLLEEPHFGPEAVPKAQLRNLYGALTSDMRTAAAKQGPLASRALARATTDYGTRMRVIERLEPLLKPDATERTFSRLNAAAGSTASGDAGLLRAARETMTPDEWGDIGAATIRKLGVPTPGAKDILEGNFSVSSFTTNWNKLSGRAKDLLFGADTPGSQRAGLETLSRVAQAQKNVGRLANVSHSGEIGGIWRLVEGVMVAVAAGHFPWAVGAGLTGAYGVSKVMMAPGFARWLYQLPKTVATAPTTGAATAQAARSLELALTQPEAFAQQHPVKKEPPPERSDEQKDQMYRANRRGDVDSFRRQMREGAAPPP